MKDLADFGTLLLGVRYVDASGRWWRFKVSKAPRSGDVILQVKFDTRSDGPQAGRKWLLSPWMTDSEVVLTAWKAVQTAEEHEMRERFRFQGARIFGPHLDVHVMAGMARKLENLDLREEPVA